MLNQVGLFIVWRRVIWKDAGLDSHLVELLLIAVLTGLGGDS